MPFNKLIEYIVIVSLFIATLGTGFIFFETIVLRKNTYAGFYSSWQFPMLVAILIDSTLYKHINKLNNGL
jgi:hypothetical protein